MHTKELLTPPALRFVLDRFYQCYMQHDELVEALNGLACTLLAVHLKYPDDLWLGSEYKRAQDALAVAKANK